MRTRIFLIIVIVAAGLVSEPLVASDTPSQKDAISSLETSISKTNIFELPSFVMKADVQVEHEGKIFDGKYLLLWNGPQQWREEISLPGYHDSLIGGKGMIWVLRPTDFTPLAEYNVHRALGFGSIAQGAESLSFVRSGISSKDVFKKTHERKEHGNRILCYEFENEQKQAREICQSTDTGIVSRGSSYVDSDFQAVGGKVFPRILILKDKDKTLAKVSITELTASAQFPPDAFAPPANISPQAGCMNPIPPRVVKRLPPEYPQSARSARIQGSVLTEVLVGTDGAPKIGKVVKSPNPELAAASLHAIREWRYEPAMCDGQAVAQETILQINYTLSF